MHEHKITTVFDFISANPNLVYESTACGDTVALFMGRSEHVLFMGRSEHVLFMGRSEHALFMGISEHALFMGRSEHALFMGRSEHALFMGRSEHVLFYGMPILLLLVRRICMLNYVMYRDIVFAL